MRTAQEIVNQTNRLAFEFAKVDGWSVPEGYRFDRSKHPRSRFYWHNACIAQIIITSTDPEEAVGELNS